MASLPTHPMEHDLAHVHATRAEIDLGALRHNLDAIRSYAGAPARVMAVVKANAYGHGAVRISQECIRHGVEFLAVARFHEGIELRKAGIHHPMLVFEIVRNDHLQIALENDLELTVVSVEGAETVDAVAARSGRRARVHVKVDTGMGRLGVLCDRAPETIERIARLHGLELNGVYTHFATSEEPDASFAHLQLNRFHDVLEALRRKGVDIPLRHAANSGAIISLPESHLDLVRPGIMLYGYAPADGMPERFPVRPVMSIRSYVSLLKTVDAGTTISYGRRDSTTSRTRIASVPIGYADGFYRLLTNKASVIINGVRYPVVGTVCMDTIMIDVGMQGEVEEGDTVTVIGLDGAEKITAWEISRIVQTIPYEVTCLVTDRVPRVYV